MNKQEFMAAVKEMPEDVLSSVQDWLNEAKNARKEAQRVTLWRVEDQYEIFAYKKDYQEAVNLLKEKADHFAQNYVEECFSDFRLSLTYKRVPFDEVEDYL